jgi:hypothetical protein
LSGCLACVSNSAPSWAPTLSPSLLFRRPHRLTSRPPNHTPTSSTSSSTHTHNLHLLQLHEAVVLITNREFPKAPCSPSLFKDNNFWRHVATLPSLLLYRYLASATPLPLLSVASRKKRGCSCQSKSRHTQPTATYPSLYFSRVIRSFIPLSVDAWHVVDAPRGSLSVWTPDRQPFT